MKRQLKIPTSKLSPIEHLILYAICLKRNKKAQIKELIDVLEKYIMLHNKYFILNKISIPNYFYVRQRLENLVLCGFLEKINTKPVVYSIPKEILDIISEYISVYIKINYLVNKPESEGSKND